MTRLDSKSALENHRQSLIAARQGNGRQLISLCSGSGCGAYGTAKVHQELLAELSKNGLQNQVEVKLTGCHGFCEKGPIMVIHPQKYFYPQVKAENIAEIVEQTVKNDQIVERLAFKDPVSKKKIHHEDEIPFYKLQQRLIFGNNGMIDPTNIDDYIAAG